MQHTRVQNAPRERQHEFSVRDAPEVIRQVRVNDIPAAKDQRLLDLLGPKKHNWAEWVTKMPTLGSAPLQ